jgi:hypothetical protein
MCGCPHESLPVHSVHFVAMTQSKSREISILPEYSDESGIQKLKNGEREDSVDLETEIPFKFFF